MAKKIFSRLLCLVLVCSLLAPALTTESFAKEAKYESDYNLQMRSKSELTAPKTDSNPFEIKVGESINIGAAVVDKNGFEHNWLDEDFGDEEPRYTDIRWQSDDGLLLKKTEGTHNSVTAKKPGNHTITVTYGSKINNIDVKPLVITAKVTEPETPVIPKVKTIDVKGIDATVLIGETKQFKIKGYTEGKEEIAPTLSVEMSNYAKKYLDASAEKDVLTVKGKEEGTTSITLKDKDGASAVLYVSIKDPSIWKFDKKTGSLNGFKNKDNPTEVVIPAEIEGVKVRTFGKDAFRYSDRPNDTKVKNKITKLTLPEGLESMGEWAFQGNDIKEITLPSTLTDLGTRAFWGNNKLSKVNFPENGKFKSTGTSTFAQTAIEEITLPDYITEIGVDCFSGTPLKSIKFSENLKVIGADAFNLAMLEEFNIPEGIEKINVMNNGKEGSKGFLFRNFIKKEDPSGISSKGQVRLTKVYDKSGKATTINTRGVVNPQPVTIKYQDENGKDIAPSETVAGYEKNIPWIDSKETYKNKFKYKPGDGHYYKDYVLRYSEEEPSYVTNIYLKDNVTEAIIGENFYTEGKSYEFKPTYIGGYITPEAITKTISKDDNEVVFTYKEAAKVNLSVEGEGIACNPAPGQISDGRTVDISVVEPSGKTLDKLLVNEKDITAELKRGGVAYTGSFVLDGDTVVKAVYSDGAPENDFRLTMDKTALTLGENVGFTLSYRGKTIKLPRSDLDIHLESGKHLLIDEEKGTVKGFQAGNTKLIAEVKGHSDIRSEVQVEVKPVKVYVRMEDIGKSVIDKTAVVIDKLYFTKGVDYYTNVDFDAPVPVLAMEKVLREKGINTADRAQFDCGDNAGWMKELGSNLWSPKTQNGSFLFTCNDEMSNKLVNGLHLNELDDLCIFYDDDWQQPTTFQYFKEKDYEIKKGEKVEFTLMGYLIFQDKPHFPISNATLEFNNGEFVSEDKTDRNGKISYTFNSPGVYKVSAFVDGKLDVSRPYATVVVRGESEVETVGGINKDNNVECEGNKVVYTKGLSKGAAFRIKGLHLNQLLSVELDGKTLGTDDYEAKEGSIIVNLKSQAIEELPEGDYDVKMNTVTGFAMGKLKVIKQPEPPADEPENPKPDEPKKPDAPIVGQKNPEQNNSNGNISKAKVDKLEAAQRSSKTGDENSIVLFAVLLFASLAIFTFNKKYNKKTNL